MSSVRMEVDFSGPLVMTTKIHDLLANGFFFSSSDGFETGTAHAPIQGLQFAEGGVLANLPVMRDTVYLTLFGGAGPMRVQALEDRGNVVDEKTVDGASLQDVVLKGRGIVRVLLAQGHNEGLLIKIGIDVDIS